MDTLFTEQEIAFQEQAIGISYPFPESFTELDKRGYLFCQFLEALTYSKDYHVGVDKIERYIEESGKGLYLDTVHHFNDGVYIRELSIPKNLLITGMIHKHDHLVVVSKGSILVWTQGVGGELIEAPRTFKSPAGVRRIGYTNEDTVWSTVHATNETDIPVLEEYLYELRGHQVYPHQREPK